jgi:hypothetical protein
MTATIDALNAAVAEPKRDRYGRYLIVPRDGGKAEAYTRATTIADCLSDRFHLEQWKQRQVAIGLARRTDLVAQAATVNVDDKQALNKIVGEAMSAAESDKAANMGTALHAAIEAVNRDPDASVPDMLAADVALFTKTLAKYGLEVVPEHVEQVVVNESIKAAGTFDLLLRKGKQTFIADLKTGKSVDYSAGTFAIQLAIYATATSYYDYATEEHSDPVKVHQDRGLVVHLPSAGGECHVHWIDLKAGGEALEHAMWVRGWRTRKDLLLPYDPQDAPAPKRRTVRAPKKKPHTCGVKLVDAWFAQALEDGMAWAEAGVQDDRQSRTEHTLRVLADNVDDVEMAAAIVAHACETKSSTIASMWDTFSTCAMASHHQIRALARVADMAYSVNGLPYVNGIITADPRLQAWMVEQLKAVHERDAKKVARIWKTFDEIPLPKQSDQWTVVHLERIGSAFGFSFPPDLDQPAVEEEEVDDWDDF